MQAVMNIISLDEIEIVQDFQFLMNVESNLEVQNEKERGNFIK
jgi:hypothetical protein